MGWREQAITVPVEAEGLVLEGVWQAGSGRAAVVAPPHPAYGGSLDNPVVNEVAYALHREGYASLRFNWRGVGASQGSITSAAEAADADFRAALEHLHRTIDAPILAAGYSFGAIAALRTGLRDARVRSLLAVAPPLGMLEQLGIERLPKPLRVIVGARDDFAPVGPLREWLAALEGAHLEVLPEADHFFAAVGLGDLHRAVRAAA